MSRRIGITLLVLFTALVPLATSWAAPSNGSNSLNPADNPSREFVTSCTYGVMAGTLVGVASLAFTSRPGDNLDRVARGASIGLYTGILLGLYVIYIVPGMDESPEPVGPIGWLLRSPLSVAPTFARNHIDGMTADWAVLRF